MVHQSLSLFTKRFQTNGILDSYHSCYTIQWNRSQNKNVFNQNSIFVTITYKMDKDNPISPWTITKYHKQLIQWMFNVAQPSRDRTFNHKKRWTRTRNRGHVQRCIIHDSRITWVRRTMRLGFQNILLWDYYIWTFFGPTYVLYRALLFQGALLLAWSSIGCKRATL